MNTENTQNLLMNIDGAIPENKQNLAWDLTIKNMEGLRDQEIKQLKFDLIEAMDEAHEANEKVKRIKKYQKLKIKEWEEAILLQMRMKTT